MVPSRLSRPRKRHKRDCGSRRTLVTLAPAHPGDSKEQVEGEKRTQGVVVGIPTGQQRTYMFKEPYMFKEQLMFLRAIMDLRPTEDNLEEDVEEPLEQHSSACEAEGPSSPPPTDVEEGRASSASQATAPPPMEVEAALAGHTRRKRPAQPVHTSVNLQVLEYLNHARHEDTFDLYARSLATHFRNLPPERYFHIQSVISIALEAATPPNVPSDLFRACEYWRIYGNTSGPVPRPPLQMYPQPSQYPPQGQHYGPPPQHYGPTYSGEAAYRANGPLIFTEYASATARSLLTCHLPWPTV
ncbi:uncharacterized protein LOC120990702 [Bufo bufo]|uniref:uncharacterized protein LOC120990702 n=1 Tax=Bufo bufo TaxID=8384 RepID=UPI001ABDBE9C|nr:uncharacterized protein LOC120990702 [Bufo bufo]